MINKIKQLTKIFIIDYYQKLNIINNKKINKKNILFWLIGILVITLTYLSLQAIKYLIRTGEPILFLKIYLPIIAFFILFQLIMLTSNIFYYSKDLEQVLPLPIKPIELLLSKLITTIIIIYFMEALYLVIPLLMYGLLVQRTIIYFILLIFVLFIFPILFTIIISTIMLILMQFSKLIKNRDIFQLIITCLLTFILTYFFVQNSTVILLNNVENNSIKIISEKMDKINNYFLIINPIIKILTINNYLIIIKNILKIILFNFFAILLFIFIGNKIYLKNILKNIQKNNSIKKINKKYKFNKKNKIKKYVENDIKKLIKNPIYFLQNIFQYFFIIIFLINIFLPSFLQQIKNENIIEEIGTEEFKLQCTLIVIGIIQIIFTFCNLSITAISRDGQDAIFIKYIPISLYTQFKLKNLHQILINTLVIISIILTIYFNVTGLQIYYGIITFCISMWLNIINSYLMVLIDLKKPNLNWTDNASLTKDNNNKLYQYVLTIFIILILNYFSKIFKNINYIKSIIIINLIFILFILILKKYIKNKINKLFEKIY